MIYLRKAEDRGHLNFGWLDTHHSFSFGDYYDQRFMGYRSLRVINDDRIAAGAGFPTHGHRDMEIVTYMLDGAIAHKDSLGSSAVTRAGEIQVMSAGTGIRHSEFNPSETEGTRLLQIWLLPGEQGIAPRYDQHEFGKGQIDGQLRLLASPDGREGSIVINQDALIHAARLKAGESVAYEPTAGRGIWVQVARGTLSVNGVAMKEGDGLAVEDEAKLTLDQAEEAEVLVFDLA